jgi:MobA/VirD2-like, nuclease domain
VIASAPDNGERGNNTYGLLGYLFGPGKANEHTKPHLVAAWDPEWLAGGAFAELIGQRGWMARLAREIDAAMTGHDVVVDGGHVYHVSISVPPADSGEAVGFFGDALWRELVESAVEHMGFGPSANGTGGCRWVAVHHGLSAEGNDHVHLLVNLVRGDGRIASTYRDFPRWREWCMAVEERLDITRTAPAGAGRWATSRAELEQSAKAGTATDRQRLTKLVTEAATAAISEVEFLGNLQRAGVNFKPHIAGGKVTGYAVSLPTGPGPGDSDPLWFGGSTLRRNLSLPRLRARWDHPGEGWEDHAGRWWTGQLSVDATEQNKSNLAWRRVERAVRQANSEIPDYVGGDRDRWSEVVGQEADLVTILSRFDPKLDAVADQLARAAQLERGRRRPRPRQQWSAAPLLAQAARLAATCKDPKPLVLAAVIVLVWKITTVLLQLAEQLQLRAWARQQIKVATHELDAHPAVEAQRHEDERPQAPTEPQVDVRTPKPSRLNTARPARASTPAASNTGRVPRH